ncbi:hypothetical protein BX666DRAFT_1921500, partial [Dichotomocladium elegans]
EKHNGAERLNQTDRKVFRAWGIIPATAIVDGHGWSREGQISGTTFFALSGIKTMRKEEDTRKQKKDQR